MNTTLTNLNETLVNITNNIATAKELRNNAVSDVIATILNLASENSDLFTTKKTAITVFCKQYINSDIDNYTKRAVKVAKCILVDGYKVKKEVLTLSQIENLLTFNKNLVNKLMKIEDDEDYIQAVKDLINTAKVEKTTKVFSKSLAKEL
jgi:hypothetical protein